MSVDVLFTSVQTVVCMYRGSNYSFLRSIGRLGIYMYVLLRSNLNAEIMLLIGPHSFQSHHL